MILASANPSYASAPIPALVVLVVVLLIGVAVARRVARSDPDPRLFKLIVISLALHLAASEAQILVTKHFYHGVADYNRYLSEGVVLGREFRSFDFSLAHSGITTLIGDGSMGIAVGIVMVFVGANQLATFFVFALLSWLGLLAFYRAYRLTFPDAAPRRYALMLFLLPSLIFWTADSSKEALLTLSLGIATLGVARVLARRKRGFILIILGTAIGVTTRPNELALLLVSFAVAIMLRVRVRRTQSFGALRKVATFAFLVAVLALSGTLTAHFLHNSGGATVTNLQKLNKGNQGQGAGFGSSDVPYHSDPLYYPQDVYTVLFDPLPVTAHSGTQLIAAAENTTILVLILMSRRQLRCLLRIARVRPYVLVSALYTAGFLYAFAALGNLGLIDRERALLLPYLLVLLCIPVAPKGHPPIYPWEVRGLTRAQKRQMKAGAGYAFAR